MRDILYISAGAIVGANARYFFERWVTARLGSQLSWGILFINVLGSLLVGFFVGIAATRAIADPRWRWLIVTGFAGAFTTFSTYALESVEYLRAGLWPQFTANVVLNNLLSLLAVVAGAGLASLI